MKITADQLADIYTSAPRGLIESTLDDLNHAMESFFIDSRERVSAFLAQVAVESGELKHREENLNYSAQRLLQVFPRHFVGVDVNHYARSPQRIANRVYANRMGNGPESSGDGWEYRGRGFIQLTGKDNYRAFARSMGMSLEETVDYMGTTEGASMSAAWFFEENGLNPISDRGQIDEVSRIVNAGPRGSLSSVHGLEQRRSYYRRAMSVIR